MNINGLNLFSKCYTKHFIKIQIKYNKSFSCDFVNFKKSPSSETPCLRKNQGLIY